MSVLGQLTFSHAPAFAFELRGARIKTRRHEALGK